MTQDDIEGIDSLHWQTSETVVCDPPAKCPKFRVILGLASCLRVEENIVVDNYSPYKCVPVSLLLL